MERIRAKYNSVCASTGVRIRKGDEMFYDSNTRKCYSLASQKDVMPDDGAMVQANEEAYFDNFCYANNI